MQIFGKEYTPKFTLRSLFIFENLTGKAFEITTLFDMYVYFYSCLSANNDNPSIEFDTFIDWCDEHNDAMKEFNELLIADRKKKNLFFDDEKKSQVENH